jgi:hypothetical protein
VVLGASGTLPVSADTEAAALVVFVRDPDGRISAVLVDRTTPPTSFPGRRFSLRWNDRTIERSPRKT